MPATTARRPAPAAALRRPGAAAARAARRSSSAHGRRRRAARAARTARRRCAAGRAGRRGPRTRRSRASPTRSRRGSPRRSQPSLVRVINATGVVVHTNLGRAPLSPRGGRRGSPTSPPSTRTSSSTSSAASAASARCTPRRGCGALLGAEAALVVNNSAAAVLLAVNTFAEGREVLVSRGRARGDRRLVPHPRRAAQGRRRACARWAPPTARASPTIEAALGPADRADPEGPPQQLPHRRLHRGSRALEELAALARAAGVPLVEDLGSGLLAPLARDARRRADRRARRCAGGVDVVTFSGDKLLGGPQAGLVAGRARARRTPMRKNPLYRALRVDKMTLAALDAALVEHELGRAHERLPVLRMLAATAEELRARAEALARTLRQAAPALAASARRRASRRSAAAPPPTAGSPTALIALDARRARRRTRLAARCGTGAPPVVARVAEGRVLLDLRTVQPDEDEPRSPRRWWPPLDERGVTLRRSRDASRLLPSRRAFCCTAALARGGASAQEVVRRVGNVTFRVDVTQAFPGRRRRGAASVARAARRGVGAARRPARALLPRDRGVPRALVPIAADAAPGPGDARHRDRGARRRAAHRDPGHDRSARVPAALRLPERGAARARCSGADALRDGRRLLGSSCARESNGPGAGPARAAGRRRSAAASASPAPTPAWRRSRAASTRSRASTTAGSTTRCRRARRCTRPPRAVVLFAGELAPHAAAAW